jgi:trigger factor
VQRRLVPELDDAFAQSLGHADLAELKAEVRRQLEEAAQRQADDFLERDLLQQVVERSTITFPDAMVDEEVAATMDGLIKDLERRRLTLDDYLRSAGKTLAQFEEELAEDARRKIHNSLVLMKIAEENQVAVEDPDIEAEIQRRARAVKADPGMMRRLIEEREGEMDRLQQQLFFRKTLEFLKSVAKITEAV